MKVSTSRKLRAVIVIVLAGAPPVLLGAYGAYLHSPLYRHSIERMLQDVFGLDAHVGRAEPVSLATTRYHDVRMSLPDGHPVFYCQVVRVDANGVSRRQYNLTIQGASFALDDKHNAMLVELSRRNYTDLGVNRVVIRDSAFDLDQHGLTLSIRQAGGEVTWLDWPRQARIDLEARQINGYATDEPAKAWAFFSPDQFITLQSVHLEVPSLPVAAILAECGFGEMPPSGQFQGRLDITGLADRPSIELQGRVIGMSLADWTGQFGVVYGSADIAIENARIVSNALRELRGSLQIRDLKLESLGRALGVQGLTGTVDLNVSKIELVDGVVRTLDAAGTFDDVAIGPLTRLAGLGEVGGACAGRLTKLTVRDGNITELTLLARGVPSPGTAASKGTIPGELLARILKDIFDRNLPRLFQRAVLGYGDLNVEIRLDDGKLHVGGQMDEQTGIRRPVVKLMLGPIGWPVSTDFDAPIDVSEKLAKLEETVNTMLVRATRNAPATTTRPDGQ